MAAECFSHLLCGEDASNVVGWDDGVQEEEEEEEEEGEEEDAFCSDFPAEGDEAISVLVQKECDHMPQECYLERFRSRALDSRDRQNAIGWILKVHAYYKFGPLTAYLSINYLDRFLSRHQLPGGKAWMLQLLSVACMSLAAKMEETRVPFLLDLQVEDPKFIFEARTIQRMELLVLTTLEWRMRSITPFSFIDYFFRRGGVGHNKPPPGPAVARATELILQANRVIDFLEHRPSAVAAAAVLCAAEEVSPTEGDRYRKAIISFDKERIIGCYNLMRELLIDRYLTSRKALYGSQSTPQSPVGVLDAAACLSTSGSLESKLSVGLYSSVAAKRRKLNDYCQALCGTP